MPGIDGLRAVAVLAVFFYHVGADWMPGGFLGVDVFFVISGYLITALLLSEFEKRGHIDVLAFWLRRARRLLPAVAVMIAVVLIVSALFVPEEIGGLRGDAVASLFYVNNWHLVLTDQSYFESFERPSLFRHLWSLAVEEQFYLLWPLLCAAGLRLLGKRKLLYVVLGGIVVSALLMMLLSGDDGTDVSRVFYGTDTRASALLVGVALAIVWHPSQLPGIGNPRLGRVLDVLGVVALILVLRDLFTVDDFDPSIYDGRFLLLALWTGVLVAGLAHPETRFKAVLASAPVVWLGVRSYGFYLWHWPVITLTRPNVDVPIDGPFLVILQLLATLGLAELSFRYVETPFRRRKDSPSAPDWLGRGRPALAAAVILSVIVVGWGGFAAEKPASADQSAAVADPAAAEVDEVDASRVDRSDLPQILAVGDSVMEGASIELQERFGRRSVIDANVARQAAEYPGLFSIYGDAGELPEHVVVQVGNNGPVYPEDMLAIRAELEGVPHVYFVNVEVPRSWESQVNEELGNAVATWPEAQVLDWNGALAEGGAGLTFDGIHPSPEGEVVYADLIVEAVLAEEAAATGETAVPE